MNNIGPVLRTYAWNRQTLRGNWYKWAATKIEIRKNFEHLFRTVSTRYFAAEDGTFQHAYWHSYLYHRPIPTTAVVPKANFLRMLEIEYAKQAVHHNTLKIPPHFRKRRKHSVTKYVTKFEWWHVAANTDTVRRGECLSDKNLPH